MSSWNRVSGVSELCAAFLVFLRFFSGLPEYLLFKNRELDLLFDGINTIHQDANFLTHGINFVIALANNLAGVLVEDVVVVAEAIEWNQPFDKKIGEFHEKSEFGHADDQSVEIFSDAIFA